MIRWQRGEALNIDCSLFCYYWITVFDYIPMYVKYSLRIHNILLICSRYSVILMFFSLGVWSKLSPRSIGDHRICISLASRFMSPVPVFLTNVAEVFLTFRIA